MHTNLITIPIYFGYFTKNEEFFGISSFFRQFLQNEPKNSKNSQFWLAFEENFCCKFLRKISLFLFHSLVAALGTTQINWIAFFLSIWNSRFLWIVRTYFIKSNWNLLTRWWFDCDTRTRTLFMYSCFGCELIINHFSINHQQQKLSNVHVGIYFSFTKKHPRYTQNICVP